MLAACIFLSCLLNAERVLVVVVVLVLALADGGLVILPTVFFIVVPTFLPMFFLL